jgi:lipoyl(octanoyl) transferase
MRPFVKLLNLNQMCYRKAFDIQMKTMLKIQKSLETGVNVDNIENTLILVEHKPVYTIGIRTKLYNDNNIEVKLKGLGADFVRTNRGGLITFHGLGQLVAYPILYLGSFNSKKSIKWYVRQIELTIIDLCQSFGINASVIDGFPGVWVNSNERKIAAIGLHASKCVTMHGLAINCNVDLKWFDHIVPCGIPDKKVTSLSNELKRDVTIDEVVPRFLDSFTYHFNCDIR